MRFGKSPWRNVCNACWNKHVRARRHADKLRRQEGQARGRDYWTGRGIAVGNSVQMFCPSWTGLGGSVVKGVAKAGVRGAYVSTKQYPRKQLAPGPFHAFTKA